MKIIFLGKPMSGKGTMAKIVSKNLKLKHISTGDLLRKEVKNKTKIGVKVENIMKKGELVPDNIVLEILKKNLPTDNYIFDGFPRTLPQAKELESFAKINLVIDIDVKNKTIENRCTKRRSCTKCGKIYGADAKPIIDDQCDVCKIALFRRKDDNIETIQERLREYKIKTQPLEKFYEDKKILKKVNGEQGISIISSQIQKMIETVK